VSGYLEMYKSQRDLSTKLKSRISRIVQELFELNIPLPVKNYFISFGDSDGEKELNTSRTDWHLHDKTLKCSKN
jgi:hypothetical protein